MKVIRILLLICIACLPALGQQAVELKIANVNGVELHYQDRGEGEPVVLVHGGFVDYRSWNATAGALSKEYRVISYSRRNCFPNESPAISPDFSAYVDAQDLRALIESLALGPVHMVGHSWGGRIALIYAIEHPEGIRSLMLAEPALVPWLADMPEGKAIWERFDKDVRSEAGAAYRAGDIDGMLEIFFAFVSEPRTLSDLPPMAKVIFETNAKDGGALFTADDAFGALLREDVKTIQIPALLLSGANTNRSLSLTDDELAHLLPNVKRVTIPNATHGMFAEQPAACIQAILAFLGEQ